MNNLVFSFISEGACILLYPKLLSCSEITQLLLIIRSHIEQLNSFNLFFEVKYLLALNPYELFLSHVIFPCIQQDLYIFSVSTEIANLLFLDQ